MNFILKIWQNIEGLAGLYNLNLNIFATIYILSIIPFYGGYFLIIYGSTKEITLGDILRLRINKLKLNKIVITGVLIHTFGVVMPYAYIFLWGRNLPWFIYLVIIFIISVLTFYFLTRLYKIFAKKFGRDSIIIKKEKIIENTISVEELWRIYNNSFLDLNKKTPCKQSFDKEHFIGILKNLTVFKYLVFHEKDQKLIGIGMITNNIKNAPWISEEYFKTQFSDYFVKNLVYYFLGIAILNEYREREYATLVIKKIFSDLPKEAIMGFDHSQNMNPFIPRFVDIFISKGIKKKHLDNQRYYIVFQK